MCTCFRSLFTLSLPQLQSTEQQYEGHKYKGTAAIEKRFGVRIE